MVVLGRISIVPIGKCRPSRRGIRLPAAKNLDGIARGRGWSTMYLLLILRNSDTVYDELLIPMTRKNKADRSTCYEWRRA
jgi:hypothetical protein